ncbi:hypothetical protein EVG20_g3021 [Dentipellis fragilis]|uniref:Uncharacterized protein n=1 Tax=Dentipellis fragilis TaxID=205917 RepID=A0A4Y9Z5H6_9AGAM|nr:hypothetical protein EVG20_g3021 [Dentipellis fragilis]
MFMLFDLSTPSRTSPPGEIVGIFAVKAIYSEQKTVMSSSIHDPFARAKVALRHSPIGPLYLPLTDIAGGIASSSLIRMTLTDPSRMGYTIIVTIKESTADKYWLVEKAVSHAGTWVLDGQEVLNLDFSATCGSLRFMNPPGGQQSMSSIVRARNDRRRLSRMLHQSCQAIHGYQLSLVGQTDGTHLVSQR